MRIKRYVAPDMRRAMRQVRETQGPDAVILSSKRIDEGIEVITAIDCDPRSLEHGNRSVPETSGDIAFGRAAETWAREPTLIGMKQEVASLRKLLESRFASLAWNDESRRHPARAGIIRELSALGVPSALARELAEATGDSEAAPVSAALRLLQDRLPVLEREIFDESGAVALVGPTGVGKTTTIAKLAARFVLKHGADELSLITTDGFLIGAQEQLISYGRILGVPVQHVRDGRELTRTLNAMSDKKLILIDSAGMSQRDQGIYRELAAIRDNGAAIRVLLTLSSNAQHAVLDESIKAFAALEPIGCVLTKIDEAVRLGGALSVIIASGLPLAYVTDGQRVPEDLHWAGGKRFNLIERALELRPDSADGYPEVAAHA